MVCSNEIYQWFKELSPFNRIDFLCSLMQLCLPNELRFIGTLLDDMNNKDYVNLREAEDRSNSPNEFRKYPLTPFTEEGVRQLCLSLSLLKSTNQKVGQIIYEILKIHSGHASQCMSLKNQFSNEILLLYALASYHPAFSFENRFKIGKQFKMLQNIYEDASEEFSNKNNSCCFKDFNESNKFIINVKSIQLMNLDADITLEISSNYLSRNVEKSTKFSKIKELFNEYKSLNPDLFSTLHSEINNITKNGHFTVENISRILEKICKIIDSSKLDDVKILKDFFLQLPAFHKQHTNSLYFKSETSPPSPCGDLSPDDIEQQTSSYFTCKNQNDLIDTKSIKCQKQEFKKLHSEKNIDIQCILKPDICADTINIDLNNQSKAEISSFCESNMKIPETFDSTQSEMSDSVVFSEGSAQITSDLSPIQIQYFLPHYSVFTAVKSSSTSPYSYYTNSSFEQVHNSNKMSRSLISEPIIVPHHNIFHFNSRINSYVPMLCSINPPFTFAPTSEINYDLFSQRIYNVTTANIPSYVAPATKLLSSSSLSSSTPPRLQSSHQKSSQYSINFSSS